MKLRIGYLSTFYHTSVLMIARHSIENDIRIDVEWKLFGTGPAIVDAFEKRELDLAYIGLPPAIIGIDRGINIKCIAGGHVEGTVICGGRQFRGFPEINDLGKILKQFVGHKIGVPGKGSIHDIIIVESLEKFSLKKEIQIINFQWADQVLEAIHKEKVSVAVGTPALAVAVKNYLDGKILYPPSRLWPNNPSYGILIENNFLANTYEIVKKFLILHEDASSFLRNRPVEASRIISDYVGVVDNDFVLDTLMISPKYCVCLTDKYIASTMEFVKALKRLGYINREISTDEIFDTSLIRKIHPEKDHYGDGLSFPR
jgi:NitT/TauT family transport system substrate-binding protein